MPKHAILMIWAPLVIEICKNGSSNAKLTGNALPEDAKFVSAGHDYRGMLYLVLESESFRDLQEGEETPVLPDPQFIKLVQEIP